MCILTAFGGYPIAVVELVKSSILSSAGFCPCGGTGGSSRVAASGFGETESS